MIELIKLYNENKNSYIEVEKTLFKQMNNKILDLKSYKKATLQNIIDGTGLSLVTVNGVLNLKKGHCTINSIKKVYEYLDNL